MFIYVEYAHKLLLLPIDLQFLGTGKLVFRDCRNLVDRHLVQLLSNDELDASHESLALHVTGQLENRLQLIHTLRVGLRIVFWLLFKIHFSWWRVLEQIVKHELSGRLWEWNIEWSIDFDVSRRPIRILSRDGFHENWTLFDDFTLLDDGWILRILEENRHFTNQILHKNFDHSQIQEHASEHFTFHILCKFQNLIQKVCFNSSNLWIF
ncbi:hypothetical protein GCK72_008393 [Caenorhabditis remanei]|uniref:Uncharacterized protein n=1 Tax=Caenorhabditis remanei TaxID=31234 RepID=A0A6A5GYI7_CAERE|nr:hypothetical protein GCK72_008393 [Caenorhabditis remanei]KAF1760147.1 hypothetical protein GCK72_008393 [Caenorhabditis remanei]